MLKQTGIHLIILLLVVSVCRGSSSVDLRDAFSNFPSGCTTLYDSKSERYFRYNEERCRSQFLPASTFKILNAMIALETGVIDGPDFRMEWDGKIRSVKAWNRDHDLKSAIRNSVVWYFEKLAKMVGAVEMRQRVTACDYGNARTSGEQPFWLVGDLAISADEQVEFLKRLHARELPFSKGVMDTVCELLFLEETDESKLYGKTGWTVKNGINIGWFVGWVESPGQTVYFATNLQSPTAEGFSKARKAITMECLVNLGFWK